MSRARDLADGTFSGALVAASADLTGAVEAATVRADTVSNAAGTGPATLTGQYAAKFWVNFNGSGTPAARDSFNLSSITDNGTGDYTLSYSNNFADGNYACLGSQTYSNVNTDQYVPKVRSSGDYAVGSVRVYALSAAGTLFDYDMMNFTVTGDLA